MKTRWQRRWWNMNEIKMRWKVLLEMHADAVVTAAVVVVMMMIMMMTMTMMMMMVLASTICESSWRWRTCCPSGIPGGRGL
eukprot:5725285-Pleurochrysis_carterae.AAC.1